MNVFDSKTITIPCPNCGEKIQETIGRLKHNPKIPCPGCGKTLAINADELTKGVDSAQKSIDNFRRSLGRFGKKS